MQTREFVLKGKDNLKVLKTIKHLPVQSQL